MAAPLPIANPAPWREPLELHIHQPTHNQTSSKMPAFALATISPSQQPRVRILYQRGFWGSVSSMQGVQKPSGDIAIQVWKSDCPTFITGSKSNKALDISSVQDEDFRYGGSQVEVVYYFEDIQVQWRIRGMCYLLSPEQVSSKDWLSDTSDVKNAIQAYMRPCEEEAGSKSWSWMEEVTAHLRTIENGDEKSFFQKGYVVGIICPQAVEMRDTRTDAKRAKIMWGLSEVIGDGGPRELIWSEIKAWP